MEAEVKFAVDLKIPRPHEIQVDGESPTMNELMEYRRIWIQEAEENGRLEDIFRIVKALGESTDVSKGKLYIGAFPLVLVEKNVKLVYWPQTKHLEVFVVGRCWASIHDKGSAMSGAGDFYIPGPWQAVLSRLAGRAEKKLIQIQKDMAKLARAELIDQLLGGCL